MPSLRRAIGFAFASSATFALTACALVAGIQDFHSGSGAGSTTDGQAPSNPDGQGTPPIGTGDSGPTPSEECAAPCGVGVCFQGKCYPEVVATGLAAPRSIAVVGSIVAWLEAGGGQGKDETALRSCPKTGCPGGGPTTITSSSAAVTLRHASEDSGNVTFTDPARAPDATNTATDGPLFAVQGDATLAGGFKGGGFIETHTITLGVTSTSWYAFLATNGLWYGKKGDALGSGAGNFIGNAARTLAIRNDLLVHARDGAGIGGCVLGANACGANVTIAEPGVVVDMTLAPTAVGGASLYYVIQDGTTLGSALPPTTLGPSMGDVGTSKGLAVDDKFVYVASAAKGLVAIDRAAKTQQSLFGVTPTSVASDGTFVYWTEEASGRILRGPRPL